MTISAINAHLYGWGDDELTNPNAHEWLDKLKRDATAHLIGAQPPPSMHPGSAHWHRHSPMFCYPPRSAGSRCRDMSGYMLGEYIHGLQRHNLLREPVSRTNPSAWNARLATERAKIFMTRFRPRHVILCGKQVQAAFGRAAGTAPCERWLSMMWPGVTFYAIPHPSGRNTQNNDSIVKATVRAYFDEVKPTAQQWVYFKFLREQIIDAETTG